MEKWFITHIRTERGTGIPKDGILRSLPFYTRIEGSPGKFYWGDGNNAHSEGRLRDRVKKGRALVLPQEVELIPNREIWFNNKGEVFYANTDLVAKGNDIFEKRFLFTSPELLRLCK